MVSPSSLRAPAPSVRFGGRAHAPPPEAGATPRRTHGPAAIRLIRVAAIATRAVTFGNPLADMDDQFYWLVGRSMWQGAWPILDIWDRKPVGLFLLYGAIAGVDRSILAVQIAATLFAAGTALVVRAAALHIASPRAALLAALSYLLILPLFGGQSGQSPVFYNLFIAGAGALMLTAATDVGVADIRRRGFAAMALCGIALVIKQVSVAEGAFIGLAFLFLLHRASERTVRIIPTAAAMIVVALVPTILGAALFALRGQDAVAAYVQASYLSIFAKGAGGNRSLLGGVTYLLLFGGPLLLAAAIGTAARWKESRHALAHRLVAGWVVAGMVGYVLIPNFFPHYALPMLVPLSVMAARAYDQRIGAPLFIALAACSLISGQLTNFGANRRIAADFERIAATIEAERHGGCLYIANGPVALYAAVPACRLTAYLFPYHLTLPTEAKSVGVDQQAEIERIFAARPAIVVTQDDERPKQSAVVRATLDRELAANYRLITLADPADELSTLRLWQRRDLTR
jgi:4-amino-4-deoxy-L-arabinose transferase-like glycosyltransferase